MFIKYMSANINIENWPVVLITFNNHREKIELFLQRWKNLYLQKEEFDIIFDARELSSFSMSDIYKISQFMMDVRQYNPQYCKNTVIVVRNQYLKYLLDIIFSFQKPFTNYYLYISNKEVNLFDLYNQKDLYPEKFTIVKTI